jgi:CHAT domain-containing protein
MPDLVFARKMLEMASHLDAEHLRHGLCASPSLLRRSIRDALRPLVKSDALLHSTLERADALADQILAKDLPFSFSGASLIEMLARQVDAKEISLADALERARTECIVDSLIPLYVSGLANFEAANLAHEGEWRKALTLLRLLRSAVGAAPQSSEREQNLVEAESVFVEAAIWSLTEVPDRRLLEEAVACGERVVARTNPANGDDHGLILMRLGVLHLDPYVKFRDLANYRVAFDLWHEAFGQEYGASAGIVPYKEWRMPSIEEAIPKAVAYLRRAADARKGRERGLSLKALVEALDVLSYLQTHKIRSVEAEGPARKALELLDPKRDADHVLTLQQRLGIAPPIGASVGVGLPPRKQVAVVLMEAKQRLSADPRGALTALQAAKELFDVHALPQQRMDRLQTMAMLLRPAFAADEELSHWGQGWEEKLATLQEKFESGKLHGRELAVCALELALLSATEDKEQHALPVLSIASESDPTLAKDYDEVLRFASYSLYAGAGANAWGRKDFQNALTAYLAALGVSLSLRLGNFTLDMLERANDVLDKAGTVKVTKNVLALLGANWLSCEEQLQESGALGLAQLGRQLDRSVFSESSEDGQTVWMLWQLAKGLRFGCSLSAGAEPAPREESEVLEEIRHLEGRLDPAETPRHDDDAIMVSVLRSGVVTKGSDAFVQLANQQHKFDVARQRRLGLATPKPRFVGLNDVTQALDNDSALLNLFLSESPEHTLALRWFCVFQDGGVAGRMVHAVSASPAVTEINGLEVVLHPLAPVVLELRAQIRAEAGFEPITSQGAEMLDQWETGLLGQIRSALGARPATKHLVVVPHGPLHFAPLHLLGPAQSMIGDRVVITYLPNLALLGRPTGPRIEGILSVGIGFQNKSPRGLAPLIDAPEEARAIAELFGALPLPEQEATPQRIRELLPRHRFVHLATHGAQNAFAPAFHHLYLTPGIDREDRLFAHDLDGMDLSSLELVTLSACESALGRVDATDNLRGLAASLFRCGAQTIVGTLWPTGSKVCREFFTTLYRGLKNGASKRDAFAAAQRETRHKHPEYRAWGSFYLMGDWR